MLSDDGFVTKRHCLRSNRQKLSTARAYYPGILVSIFATSNFMTECLLKVRSFMMISWYHYSRINVGWKMVYYKTEQTWRKYCLPAFRIKVSSYRKLKIIESPSCSCGGFESNYHYLFTCPKYTNHRNRYLPHNLQNYSTNDLLYGKGVVGWCEGAVYLRSPGRPTDIGLQLGKACYPCSG